MNKRIRGGLLPLLFTMLFTVSAEAATLTGMDTVDGYLAHLPDSVVTLYREKGGQITIVPYSLDALARKDGHDKTNVRGLYFWHSLRIYVTYTTDLQTAEDLAHEFGHFLYHETRPSWDADIRERYQDDEAFAQLYSAHVIYDALPPDDYDAVVRIEETVGRLAQKHTGGL